MPKFSIETLIILLLAGIGILGVSIPRIDGLGGSDSVVTDQPETEEEVGEADSDTSDTGETSESAQADGESEVDESDDAEEESYTQAATDAPQIDMMRFDRNQGVVAGVAAPNAEIVIRDGDEEITRGQADANGNFALLFDYEAPADGAILELSSVGADGQEVAANQALTVLPQEGAESTTAALTDEGVEINTLPGGEGLNLTDISYGATSPLLMNGTALPGAVVDIFLDGAKIGTTTADDNGQWSYEAEQLAPGDYELGWAQNGSEPVTRKITLEGAPDTQIAEASTDAENESTGAGDASQGTGGSSGSTSSGAVGAVKSLEVGQTITIGDRHYVVKRGDSLWRIAEHFYGDGEGYRYTEIFDVNSSQIRNPDLIYPDQEFDIPEEE